MVLSTKVKSGVILLPQSYVWVSTGVMQTLTQVLVSETPFSATLTRDPSKVAALSLHHPQYYIVQSSSAPALPTSVGEQFALPSSLSEKMLILPPALKPLNLIHLIHHPEFNVDRALVFTKSVESAARLVKLLEFFEDAYVLGGGGGKRLVIEQYSGEMRARDKKQLLAEFGEGKINLLV